MPNPSINSGQRLPSGTVTFLFTDIEGSTSLAQQFADELPTLLARHHAILHQSIEAHNGHVFQIRGDAFCAAFYTAGEALQAALDAQLALQHETWIPAPIRVRMGIHAGSAQASAIEEPAGEYTGYLTLTRVQRVMSVAHGGQVLLSNSTAELVRGELPADVTLRDMGEHRLKGLLNPEHLWQLIAPDLQLDFPSLQSLNAISNNLPVQLTSFIGRENELAEIKQELTEHRLVTLTGSGGTGKTRLSLQVATDVLDQFDHGVWFIELAPLVDPDLIPQTILSVMGISEQPSKAPLDVLKEYLHDKKILLVLDNCEHLIGACAQVASTSLRAAPHLKILATSREALGITGETTYPVPPLSLPDARSLTADSVFQYESVRLFVDRARAVNPTFAVTEKNSSALAEICRRLDGIPLALELAAARVRGMTVEQIAQRLDKRFRLLTTSSRTAMAHHQTLQATIEWSYALLSKPECIVFQQLAVFAGSWTLEAAEQVCAGKRIEQANVLDPLLRLVDKSLVVVEQEESSARYHFLETIRQFALTKLEESGQEYVTRVRNRHLDHFLAFVEAIDQTLHGAEQESALVALDHELDNLRAALAWASKANNVEAELRLAAGLWRYWRVRSYFSEGRHWLEDALSKSEQASVNGRAKALLGAGSLANYQADYQRARVLLEASLALHRQLNDKQGVAYCLNLLSHGEMMMSDFAAAQASLDESLAIFRELGDARGRGYSLYFLGSMQLSQGDLASARPVLEESLALLRAAGDKWWVGHTLIQLGWCLNRQGEPAKALELFDAALEISAQIGDTRGTARALLYIAEAKFSQQKFDAARREYNEALKLFHEIGDKWWGTVCIEGLANIAAEDNDARRAVMLLGVAERMHELLGAPILAPYRVGVEGSVRRTREQLGEDEFATVWNEGRAMTFDDALKFAMRNEP